MPNTDLFYPYSVKLVAEICTKCFVDNFVYISCIRVSASTWKVMDQYCLIFIMIDYTCACVCVCVCAYFNLLYCIVLLVFLIFSLYMFYMYIFIRAQTGFHLDKFVLVIYFCEELNMYKNK